MNKIHKALKLLSPKERRSIEAILLKIKRSDFSSLDIRKLKNRQDIFRVREGSLRIIFRQVENEGLVILTIERRSDNTYNK